MVYNLAFNHVQNVEEAEELVQDVFVKVYQNLDRFNKSSELKTWIYRITINSCLDHLKAQKRNKRAFWNPFNRVEDDNVISISSYKPQLELDQEVELVLEIISTLPPKQKTVLLLKVEEDLSLEEIAKILECSYKAAESILGRARKNFRKNFEIAREKSKSAV